MFFLIVSLSPRNKFDNNPFYFQTFRPVCDNSKTVSVALLPSKEQIFAAESYSLKLTRKQWNKENTEKVDNTSGTELVSSIITLSDRNVYYTNYTHGIAILVIVGYPSY